MLACGALCGEHWLRVTHGCSHMEVGALVGCAVEVASKDVVKGRKLRMRVLNEFFTLRGSA